MKITNEECEALKKRGYSINDIKEIRFAAKKTEYTTKNKDDKIIFLSEKEVHEKLGHELWLKTLCKSAFSINVDCQTDKGEAIHFHSKVYAN